MFISKKDKKWLEDKIDEQYHKIYNLQEMVSILANHLGLEFVEMKSGYSYNFVAIPKETVKVKPFNNNKGEK